jgi:hypothetical protein
MRPDQPIPPFDPTPVTVTKPVPAILASARIGEHVTTRVAQAHL